MLGSALIGGVFFAFSSFVIKALARIPSEEGIAAMQSINVVVLNPSFLGVFIGTTVISVLVAALAMNTWATPSALSIWEDYLDRWTLLNTIHTGAAAAASLMVTLGLLQSGCV